MEIFVKTFNGVDITLKDDGKFYAQGLKRGKRTLAEVERAICNWVKPVNVFYADFPHSVDTRSIVSAEKRFAVTVNGHRISVQNLYLWDAGIATRLLEIIREYEEAQEKLLDEWKAVIASAIPVTTESLEERRARDEAKTKEAAYGEKE